MKFLGLDALSQHGKHQMAVSYHYYNNFVTFQASE